MRIGVAAAVAVALLLVLLGAKEEGPQDLVLCTDFGPLVAVEHDGRLSGTLAGVWPVSGTSEQLTVELREGGPGWTGSLAGLHPAPPIRPDPVALAQDFASRVDRWRARKDRVVGPGFRGRVGVDGVLRGLLRGRPHAWAIAPAEHDEVVFGGPAPLDTPIARLPGVTRGSGPDLEGDPLTSASEAPDSRVVERVVQEHLHRGGWPSCPAPTRQRVFVGVWPIPIEIPPGHRLASVADHEVLIRSEEGAAWLTTLRLSPLGASVALGELNAAAPLNRTEARTDDGIALLLVGRRTAVRLEGGRPVEPSSRDGGALLAVLGPDPTVLPGSADAEAPVDPRLAVSAELVAHVNDHRAQGGLPPIDDSPGLAWAAVGHGLYLDRTMSGMGGHDQDPESPWFVGARPSDRGGAAEVLVALGDRAPREAVDVWMATPFHRAPLVHPGVTAGGGGALPRGTAVLEIEGMHSKDVPDAWTWPVDRQLGVPLAFSGYETPDPLPAARFPDKLLPLGYTLSLFERSGLKATAIEATWLRDADGVEVPHYVVSHLDHPHLSNRTGSVVHLLPKARLEPSTTYTWGVRLADAGPERAVRASFTTRPDLFWESKPAPPELLGLLEAVAGLREARGLAPLRYVQGLEAIAAHTTTSDDAAILARRATTGWLSVWELGDDDLGRMVEDPTSLQDDAPLLRPVLETIGAARVGERWRLVLSSDPRIPEPPPTE
jgi:hypothetical protein